MTSTEIHQGQPVEVAGVSLAEARAAMIMIHGRGGSPQGILPLSHHFNLDGFAYLAPSAANHTWYPNSFLSPRESNEPYLSSALTTIDGLIEQVKAAGIPAQKTMLLGFSQGACLSLEYVARNPQRFGGVAALSGGLIGAEGELVGYVGSLSATPIFIGCSDVDFHIPEDRVHDSAEILQGLGAEVDERIYPGMGHVIIEEEVDAVRAMMAKII